MDLRFYLSSRPRKTNFGKRKHKSSPIQEFQVKMLGITAAPRDPLPDYSAGSGPKQHRFSPYNDNGGSTVAIAGKNLFQIPMFQIFKEILISGDDFAIVASDTRLTDGGYGILSRSQPKLFNLTGNICLAATGCWADVLTLTRLIGVRIKMFKYTHNNTIQTKETAQMLSTMLYAKRFFPYSVTNILVSLNQNPGKIRESLLTFKLHTTELLSF